jgi:phosphate transport system protein
LTTGGVENVNEHTTKQFDVEMEAIRSGVLAMGGLVETQFRRAVEALRAPGDVDAVSLVASDEQAINKMQMDIDQQCSQIIAKRQPAAIDLRMILTVVKVVNELERIGDEIKKIAYKAQQMQRPERLTSVRLHDVTRAASMAEENLQLALDAFARLDVSAAADVIVKDEAIDAAFTANLRQLISYMMEDPRTISPALEIVFIAKSIERIGDHAKNIAEDVVHVVKGKDVRHATAEQIRAEVAEER